MFCLSSPHFLGTTPLSVLTSSPVNEANPVSEPTPTTATGFVFRAPLPKSYANFFGRIIFRILFTVQGIGAFALITLGVMISKYGRASRVLRPLIWKEVYRSGLRMLPMFAFISAALGLLVIGQTV